MPSKKTTLDTSGLAIFNAHEHKVGELVGLRIDNKASQDVKVDLLDCFITDASKTCAAGATQAAEDFLTTVSDGKVRLQLTVPIGEAVSLGPAELEEVIFLGKAYVRGDVTTSDVVVVASYKLK